MSLTSTWTDARLQRLFERYRVRYWPRSGRLSRYAVVRDGSIDCFGRIDYERRLLLINIDNHPHDRDVRATVLHEMCHAVVGRGGHGAAFWHQLEYLLSRHAPVTVGLPELGEQGNHLAVIPRGFRRCRKLFRPAYQRWRLELEKCQSPRPDDAGHRRRKGRGTSDRKIPLSAQAVAALRSFDALDCWGGFSTSAMWKSFQRACLKVGIKGARPYDLRHSYGTKLYAESGDPRAVQELLLHSTQKTTARYTQGAVERRLRLAVQSFDRALPTRKRLAGTAGSTRRTTRKPA